MMEMPKTQIEETRAILHEARLFEFMLKAIRGDVINNQRLSLRDRVHLAAKLSNKILPDLKSVQQKDTVEHTVNIRYQATQELISDVLDQ